EGRLRQSMASPLAALAAPPFSASREGLPDVEDPSAWEISFDRIVLGEKIGQGVTAHVYKAVLDGDQE
ncbi:unnamed protein product, partial [Polarella glacialis]